MKRDNIIKSSLNHLIRDRPSYFNDLIALEHICICYPQPPLPHPPPLLFPLLPPSIGFANLLNIIVYIYLTNYLHENFDNSRKD